MSDTREILDRTARILPRGVHAHWLLRLPLALVLLSYGLDKFPLVPEAAAGWGVPVALWALAGLAEIAAGLMLIAGGVVRGVPGDLLTRAAGAGAAAVVAGVILVAYRAPPLDLLLFNQFHILLICAGLYLALTGGRPGAGAGHGAARGR